MYDGSMGFAMLSNCVIYISYSIGMGHAIYMCNVSTDNHMHGLLIAGQTIVVHVSLWHK